MFACFRRAANGFPRRLEDRDMMREPELTLSPTGFFRAYIFATLSEARSLLYRSQILQANTRLKALDEIYKIYTYASLGEKNRIENEIMKMYTNKKYSTEKAE